MIQNLTEDYHRNEKMMKKSKITSSPLPYIHIHRERERAHESVLLVRSARGRKGSKHHKPRRSFYLKIATWTCQVGETLLWRWPDKLCGIQCWPGKDRTASCKMKCLCLFGVLGMQSGRPRVEGNLKCVLETPRGLRLFKKDRGNLHKWFWTKCDRCWYINRYTDLYVIGC